MQHGTSRSLVAGVVVVLAALLAVACSDPPKQYVGVCVDAQTHVRIDDGFCGSHDTAANSPWLWFWLLAGHTYPPIGYPVIGAYPYVPAGGVFYRGGVPNAGGRWTPPRNVRPVTPPRPAAPRQQQQPPRQNQPRQNPIKPPAPKPPPPYRPPPPRPY